MLKRAKASTEVPVRRDREWRIAQAWPALVVFVVSQVVLSCLGFVYHEYMWRWSIFYTMAQHWEASIPQILMFDVIGLVLPMGLAMRWMQRTCRDDGLGRPQGWPVWLVTLVVAGAIIAIRVVLFGWSHAVTARLGSVLGLNLVAYEAIAGFTDEAFFRGFIQSESKRALGVWWGSALQIFLSLLAPLILMDLVNEVSWKVMIGQLIVFYLPVGLLSTALREATDSAWPSMIAHAVLGLMMVL